MLDNKVFILLTNILFFVSNKELLQKIVIDKPLIINQLATYKILQTAFEFPSHYQYRIQMLTN